MRTERLKTGAYKSKELATRPARRVPPPLRFGAALVYVLIRHKPAGRDVRLAKSGFRPTTPAVVSLRRAIQNSPKEEYQGSPAKGI
jgi:hypothetical protein